MNKTTSLNDKKIRIKSIRNNAEDFGQHPSLKTDNFPTFLECEKSSNKKKLPEKCQAFVGNVHW